MQLFAELGAVIEGRWRDENYNENLLPGIAARTLRDADLIARVDPWDIIRWVHSSTNLPRQMDSQGKFGNPPVTLFIGPRFYIDIYYWLDSTPSIHQHAFSGAFQVLLGSSVHSNYTFKKKREINPHFLIGDVSLKDVSLLGKGDIKKIYSGSRFIHSLFHLERPSATIVIRSKHALGSGLQYTYLKPHLAIDPFFEEPGLTKKVQTVSLLLNMKHPEADQMICDLLDRVDFHTAFAVLDVVHRFLGRNELEELFQVSKSASRFQAMLHHVRRRHGTLADLLPPVFDESLRQADIIKRRGAIEHADHRFLLALLLNVPERMKVLELVKHRFPDEEPVELVISWVRELGKFKIFGSPEPNVLGIKSIDDTYLEVLAGLLRGLSDRRIKALSANEAVDDLIASIRTSRLFQSIFTQKATTPARSTLSDPHKPQAGSTRHSLLRHKIC